MLILSSDTVVVQTIVDTQKKRISALTASRKLLLESFNTSEGTISSLRSSLADTKADLSSRVEEIMGYKAQVIDLGESLEEAKEKGGQDGKLKEKNERLEGEVKELKVRSRSLVLVDHKYRDTKTRQCRYRLK